MTGCARPMSDPGILAPGAPCDLAPQSIVHGHNETCDSLPGGRWHAPCDSCHAYHAYVAEPPTINVCRVMQVDEDIYGGERSFTVHVEWPPMAAHILPRVGSGVTVGPSPEAFFAWMRGSQAGKERIIAAAVAWWEGWVAMYGDTTDVAGAGPLTTAVFEAVRDFQGGK